jgi:hypothetical protein
LIVRHSSSEIDQLHGLGIRNFFSTSQRALDQFPGRNTMLKPKLLDWSRMPLPNQDPASRCGVASYINYYWMWPDALQRFQYLTQALSLPAVNYGVDSDAGIVPDLETMMHSRATVHIKYGGACCFAVVRSMAMGTPVVMDRGTWEQAYFDGVEGILVRDTMEDVASELARLQSDDDYWSTASRDSYLSARRQFSFRNDIGNDFRRFVEAAPNDDHETPRPVSTQKHMKTSFDTTLLWQLHDAGMRFLFRSRGLLASFYRQSPSRSQEHHEAPPISDNKALHELTARFPWPMHRPNVQPDWGPQWFLDDDSIGHTAALRRIARPDTRVIVELGSFAGRSTAGFLRICPQSHVIAIDTWKGSAEHHSDPTLRPLVSILFEVFQANLWEQRHRLTAMRTTTIEGMHTLHSLGVAPDMIYVDADHATEAVIEDIRTAKRLFPNAQIAGDDWNWESVRSGVIVAARELDSNVAHQGNVWWFSGDVDPNEISGSKGADEILL